MAVIYFSIVRFNDVSSVVTVTVVSREGNVNMVWPLVIISYSYAILQRICFSHH